MVEPGTAGEVVADPGDDALQRRQRVAHDRLGRGSMGLVAGIAGAEGTARIDGDQPIPAGLAAARSGRLMETAGIEPASAVA